MRNTPLKDLDLLRAIILMMTDHGGNEPEGSAGQLPVLPFPAQPAPERRHTADVRGRIPRHSGTPRPRVYVLDMTQEGSL
jgi:hypothetical protein